MTQFVGLLAVALLVAASAYFVLMEFSFTAANRNRLTAAELAGDAKAAAAVQVLRRLSFTLSGAQLGITVAALVTGFIARPVFAAVFEPALALARVAPDNRAAISLALGFIVATVALMVLGELAPKNLAIAIPETVARSLARSTLLFLRVGGPVIRLFDGAANRLLAVLGITPVQESHGVMNAEDLERVIASSGSSGHLTTEEAGLLGRALDFGHLTAADVMVPRPAVITIAETAGFVELRRVLSATGHSRLPVTRGPEERVVGLVSVKDLLSRPPAQRPSLTAADLSREVLRVPETAPLGDVVAQLRGARTQFSVVVDEFGSDAGILTLEDIVEELVGEVRDEHGPPQDHAWNLAIGQSTQVPGGWRLHELARRLGVRLPDGDYDTLAGLTVAQLGRLPVVGDEVVVSAVLATAGAEDRPGRPMVRLRVEAVDQGQVATVLTVTPQLSDPS
ncbi:MAG: HlyC/CorC family transporter [Frankiales bacterium]|nr:HlyC/CorC family transporter [Frankiales bacterium]